VATIPPIVRHVSYFGTLERNRDCRYRDCLTFYSSRHPGVPPRSADLHPPNGHSPTSTMKQVSDKHFRCTVCQRGFTRIDHLKRHHLRRTCIPMVPLDPLMWLPRDLGRFVLTKPAPSIQTRESSRMHASFVTSHSPDGELSRNANALLMKKTTDVTSSDNLRDHYPDCPQRGDRQIPETGQRGRRRHACESVQSSPGGDQLVPSTLANEG
jgi:hypothetical protein